MEQSRCGEGFLFTRQGISVVGTLNLQAKATGEVVNRYASKINRFRFVHLDPSFFQNRLAGSYGTRIF